MENIAEHNTLNCPTSSMIKYSTGSCVESLVLNSFFGFSMLYYTNSLGLAASMAGLATFVATLWDAVTDPIMGHISDNTKSRFGKFHSYMFFGGVAMIIGFFFIWYVPDFFKTDLVVSGYTIGAMTMLFWYLVMVNLILRTAYTVFAVPYTALGFAICDEYAGRAKLQGIRNGMNMAANLCGPAMAHWLFFSKDHGPVKATHIAQNFINMGTVFAIASAFFLFLMLYFTAKYMKDSRNDSTCHSNVGAFFKDMKAIITDKYPRWVFIFMFFVLLGIVLVSTLQMFVFDDFMLFEGWQKTIAHGGSMVGMGLGALSLSVFVKRFEKKGAIYIAVAWSVFCELVLASLFLTDYLDPSQVFVCCGYNVPIAFILFTFFHGAYWFGNGILMPVAVSMIADVSEIHKIKTGVNKDGSYAAMFSLSIKMSMAVAGLVAGYCLTWIGFESGNETGQTSAVVWRIGALTFIAGPVASLAALAFISKYPVTKQFLEKMRVSH